MVQDNLLSLTYNAKKESEQKSVLVDIYGHMRSGAGDVNNGHQRLGDPEVRLQEMWILVYRYPQPFLAVSP